jgi:predicted ATPase
MFDIATFKDRIKILLRITEYNGSRLLQGDLAEDIGLSYQELSDRFNGRRGAVITNRDAGAIVRALAKFGAIHTQAEALELLALVDCPSFTAAEWQAPPLHQLTSGQSTFSAPIPTITRVAAIKASSKHNLPAQTTSFVGRERELQEVCDLMRRPDRRVVTLTGVGGSGKTRLGIEVVTQLRNEYDEGVYFVPLATISNPELVTSIIAKAVGVKESFDKPVLDTLKEYLGDRLMMLLLDNFEQIMKAAPLVSELLAAAPKLKVLITSRERLHIQGEQEYIVPPLALPALSHSTTLDDLADYAAVKLFVQRAESARLDFVLTPQNATAVTEICARLDGLPLAIELAAAHSKLLGPGDILRRLSAKFEFLTDSARDRSTRQQSLKSAIDWSYNQLSHADQALFRRLSVFLGGSTIEAAEAICGKGSDLIVDVLVELSSLVDKSLLRGDQAGGEPRFMMLETIREYALLKLIECGEDEEIQQRYAEYYIGLAEDAAKKLVGSEQLCWLNKLEREHDNLRAAMSWSLKHSPSMSAQIGSALGEYWSMRGYLSEGRGYLAESLRCDNITIGERVGLLYWAGRLASGQADYAIALELFQQSMSIAQELDDRQGITNSLYGMGQVASALGDYSGAKSNYERALALSSELEDKQGIANTLTGLGRIATNCGEYTSARKFHGQALELRRELGGRIAMSASMSNLGHVANVQGDYETARTLLEEGCLIDRETGAWQNLSSKLINLAETAHLQGDFHEARALQEEGLVIARQIGDKKRIAASLNNLGYLATDMGDFAAAMLLIEESLDMMRQLGVKQLISNCLNNLGDVVYAQGNYAAAQALQEESLTTARDISWKQGICRALISLADVKAMAGEYPSARTHSTESLIIAREMEWKQGIANAIIGWCWVEFAEHNDTMKIMQAVKVFSVTSRLMGRPETIKYDERARYDRAMDAVRTKLDEVAFNEAWRIGEMMGIEQAVEYILGSQS